MTNQYSKITVIGGGIVGLSCAHALQARGFYVEVIDAGQPEEKCSFGNAGSISAGSVAPLAMPGTLRKVPGMLADPKGALYVRPSYALKVAPWLWRFIRAAQPDRVEAIARALKSLFGSAVDASLELARACGAGHLVQHTGQLQLYPDAVAFEADRKFWELRQHMGVSFQVIGAGEIRELEPAVGKRYKVGVFLPKEGMVCDPWRLCTVVADDFRQRGGRIVDGRVEGFGFGTEGPNQIVVDGQARSVDKVVIAAGAWSGRLVKKLGYTVPLETQRGYHVTLKNPIVELRRPVVMADRKCFATPLEGALRLAGTVEFAGLSATPDYRRAHQLLEHGRQLLPDLGIDVFTEWMGHRPCLPDSLPVIGQSRRHRNVFLAFGHGHLGLTGAAVTGKHIADLIADRQTEIDLSPFRIDRFE